MKALWKYNRFFIGTWIVLLGIPITLLGGIWPLGFLAAVIAALFISDI